MKTFKWSIPEPRHHYPRVEGPKKKWNERIGNPLWLTSLMVFIVASLLLLTKASSPAGLLLFMPFSFGPMIATLLLGLWAKSKRSSVLLLASNLIYFAWFLWVYIDVFYIHIDPQGPIAFVFIGMASLPVMIPLWIIALVLERKNKLNQMSEQDGVDNA
ncbi:hypothetical protein [Puniceicoccus vermicola]|uniref:Uncharacterized protein n=1 Tax=Puniceicoccus vermicola TaxID=388746 RepID=A0A7X1E4X0_9BACT|nr:hypothetical protein [Puniceicoccus vermicola]MBC2602509.1 hypothetical protein [Puniceicoccus vermicola]